MKKLLSLLSSLFLAGSALAQGPIYSGSFIVKDSTGGTITGDDNSINVPSPNILVVNGRLDVPYITPGSLLRASQVGSHVGAVTVGSGLSFDGVTLTSSPATPSPAATVNLANSYFAMPVGMLYDDFSQYTGSNPTINKGVGWTSAAVLTGTQAIVTNTAAAGDTYNALSMHGTADFVRTFPWGSNWKRLRIGILMRINSGANVTCDFQLGTCSGTANPFGSVTCALANGCGTAFGNGNTWTFNAGTEYPYFVAGFSRTGSKHNTTFTVNADSGSGVMKVSASASARCLLVIELKRTAFGAVSSVHGEAFLQSQDFSAQASQSDSGPASLITVTGDSAAGTYFTTSTGINFSGALDETNGQQDSLDIFWNHASVNLEVSAICVIRLY